MASYIFSNKAVEDLSNIWNFTFDAWSEKQADLYYTLLLESCEELADSKVAGKDYPEIDMEIFVFRIMQHIIFYQSLKKDKIKIVRILHSRMDLKNRITE